MENNQVYNNTTKFTHHQYSHIQSVAAATMKATAITLIICMAVLGNTLILISIYRFSRLRTITNVFIANLAVADLLLALLGMPFTMTSSITYHWVFGDVMCNIQGFMNSLFCEASVVTLTFVSLERFVAIICPMKYPVLSTARNVKISLCFIWAQGLLCASSTFWFSRFRFLEFEHICTVDWQFNFGYTVAFTVLFFYVPFVFVIIFYSIILKTALRQQKRINNINVGEIQANNSGSTKSNLQNVRKKQREHKATITIAIVVGTFCVCWLPHMIGIHCLIIPACNWESGFFIASTWLAMLNSALNSIIYGLLNKSFARAIKNIMSCGRYGNEDSDDRFAWENSKHPRLNMKTQSLHTLPL